jgi:hypothetical protein
MAVNSFDAEDTLVWAINLFAAAVLVGAGSFELFGVALSDQTTIADVTMSVAYLLSLGAALWVVLTNEGLSLSADGLDDVRQQIRSRNDMADWYYYVVAGHLALFLAWPFFPEIESFFSSQDLYQFVWIAGTTLSLGIIGYEL